MVFDEDPLGNRDMLLYFLKKLYAEFILGKHVNYFYIIEFQSIGWFISQDIENDREDFCHVFLPPCPWNTLPPRLFPTTPSMFDEIQENYCSYHKYLYGMPHMLRAIHSSIDLGKSHWIMDMVEGSHQVLHDQGI